MRVIIAGGGTGGHIFPAVSIAEQIMEQDNNNEVLFIGTTKGMEGNLIPKKGFNIEFIRSYPILGKSLFSKLKGVIYTFVGIYESIAIFNRFKPDVVVGVGGYVSGPAVLAAFVKRLPRVICEQNSYPGITNRFLSRFANRVFITYEKSRSFFDNNKTILCGNPIQKKFCAQGSTNKTRSTENEFSILILGGSQGAAKLNEILPECFGLINQDHDNKLKLNIVHQTGEKSYDSVVGLYSKHNLECGVYKFIDNIEDYYASADLIIARSGAGTLAEICSVGRASVLIPFPHATHNHQYHNAVVLEQQGAALLVEEKDLSVNSFATVLRDILDRKKLTDMADKAKSLGKPDAAKEIVNSIYEILNLKPCMDA